MGWPAMLIPAQAALLRSAQDVPAGPAANAGAAAGTADAGTARRAAGRQAVIPPVADGQYEPMPSTMSFGEFLSGLNPLQHIPVVGTIYRAITGDVPPAVMRVAGGFLLGGPVGAIGSAIGAAAEEVFGMAHRDAAAPAAPADQAPQRQDAPTALAAGADPRATDAGERLARLRLASASYGQAQFPAVAMAQAGGARALP